LYACVYVFVGCAHNICTAFVNLFSSAFLSGDA
jgi:hypothetical protein